MRVIKNHLQQQKLSLNQFLSAAPVRNTIALLWALGTWHLIRTHIQVTQQVHVPITVKTHDNTAITWEPQSTWVTLRGSYAAVSSINPQELQILRTVPNQGTIKLLPYTHNSVTIIPSAKKIIVRSMANTAQT